MKKIFLVLTASFFINLATAQTITPVGMQTTPPGVDAPSIVTSKFGADYPNINAAWRMDEENYAADYKDNLTNMGRTVVYDRNGNVVRRDLEVEYTIYPASIGEFFTKNFPKEKYQVWSTEDAEGNLAYYAYHDYGKIVWFDKEGKYSNNKPVKASKKTSALKTKE